MDDALKKVTAGGHEVPVVLVYDHARAVPRADVPFTPGRDVWWQDAVEGQPTTCEVEWMGAEDPLFKVCRASSCGGVFEVEKTGAEDAASHTMLLVGIRIAVAAEIA